MKFVGANDFQVSLCFTWSWHIVGGNPGSLRSAFQEEFLLGDAGLHRDVVFAVLSRSDPTL